MPNGIPNIKQLDQLVSAALAQALAGGPAPMAAPASKYSFLSDPKFLAGLGAIGPSAGGPGLPTPGVTGRQSTTQLPVGAVKLQTSVNRIGNKKEHHSIFGKILDVMERPLHAVTGGLHEGIAHAVANEVKAGSVKGLLDPHNWAGNLEAGAKGVLPGLGGKTKYSGADLLDAADPNPKHNTMPGVLKGTLGFGIDVGLDPLTYTGLGVATKVKDAGQTAEAITRAKEVQKTLAEAGHEHTNAIPNLLLGNLKEGKWYRKGALPNSAQREEAMQRVAGIAEKYGHASWDNLLKDLNKQATEHIASQGYRKYDTVKELRSALKGSTTLKAAKGNVSKANLEQYNKFVDHLIGKHTSELLGGADKMSHVREQAAGVLELASKGNLAGKEAAQQLDKRLAVRFAGQDLAHVKVPKPVAEIARSLTGTKAAKPVKGFVEGIHNHVDTIFRTGSHVDPVVNAMRMAAHSSVVEKINRHVENIKSVWGHVSPAERERVATAVTQGLTHAPIAGGRDLNSGKDVTNLVQHVTNEMHHIQSLVGNHEGALVTLKEMNKQLPKPLQIRSEFATGPNWLKEAWRGQFLNDKAPYALQKMGKDPATMLHTMQKAILTASAKKHMTETIVDRFGHKLRGTQGFGMKNAKNPAAEMLQKNHGYRTPMFQPHPGANMQPIHGYEDHVFHPDVARGIESMHRMLEGDARLAHGMTTDQYTTLFKNATQMFKTVVTKFNPGFHERNLIGEMANAAADGVLSVKPYRKALQVLRLHGSRSLETGEEMGKRAARIHNGIMPDAYEKARIAAVDGHDIILHKRFYIRTEAGNKTIAGATPDMIWHAYVANGLKTGWVTTEFGKVVAGGRTRAALRGFNTKAQHVTENIEDYARLAHFISRIERSPLRDFEKAAEDAAQYVRKYHFDYNDFTNVEKNYISRAIPFYKWTRKNIPLQLALMFQKPGYMLTQMKALSGISQAAGYRGNGSIIPNAGEVMPQWLKDSLAVPVGQGSSGTRYLDAPLPTRDAFKFFGEGGTDTFHNLMYMTNPFVKDLFEAATGHQIGGAPIQTDRYVAAMTPYTNLLHNLINHQNTGKSTNLLQFLSGLGLVENTPARIKSELKRQQSEGSARRKKYRTSHGMLPVGGRSQ